MKSFDDCYTGRSWQTPNKCCFTKKLGMHLLPEGLHPVAALLCIRGCTSWSSRKAGLATQYLRIRPIATARLMIFQALLSLFLDLLL
jgi:hypothetical protein